MQTTPTFLIIQSQYEQVVVAVAQADTIIMEKTLHKHAAAAQLISTIDTITQENHLTFADYHALIAHAGPGPFTTLRVALATANGLAFASRIPLIAVNGLQALGEGYGQDAIILLNAFCDDVYFALVHDNAVTEAGVGPIATLLPYMKSFITPNTQLIGNGVVMHRERILHTLGENAAQNIPSLIPLEATVQHIASCGYTAWAKKQIVEQITPLYLKTYSAHMPV